MSQCSLPVLDSFQSNLGGRKREVLIDTRRLQERFKAETYLETEKKLSPWLGSDVQAWLTVEGRVICTCYIPSTLEQNVYNISTVLIQSIRRSRVTGGLKLTKF